AREGTAAGSAAPGHLRLSGPAGQLGFERFHGPADLEQFGFESVLSAVKERSLFPEVAEIPGGIVTALGELLFQSAQGALELADDAREQGNTGFGGGPLFFDL